MRRRRRMSRGRGRGGGGGGGGGHRALQVPLHEDATPVPLAFFEQFAQGRGKTRTKGVRGHARQFDAFAKHVAADRGRINRPVRYPKMCSYGCHCMTHSPVNRRMLADFQQALTRVVASHGGPRKASNAR
eukprot:9469720-Pyramimonas_sp.AAC.1